MIDTYTTQDFYLTAFLVAQNCQIETYDRENRITYFTFKKTDKLMQLIQSYYQRQSVIEPMAYGNSLKNLKSIIHSLSYENNQLTTAGKA